ncbi:MAG: biopolymer transporter ExbD [Phycisphaerae bacterium]|mgnify:CR=1 FL=1|nr:biopolymer transporter ExbD [Phycisphaerae bacterium]
MKFGHAPRSRLMNLDMTPMIDIVFQLLIFFLTTAQMAQMSRADLDLPPERGEEERSKEQAGLVINVTADGEIIVGDQTVSLGELEAMAIKRASNPDNAASGTSSFRPLVRADLNAPAERLNGVLTALERAGVDAVRLATNPQNDSGSK